MNPTSCTLSKPFVPAFSLVILLLSVSYDQVRAQARSDSNRISEPEILAELGNVAIKTIQPIPKLSAPIPSSRLRLAKELAREAAWPKEGLSVDLRMAAMELAWAPVGTLLGASFGAASGVSKKKLDASVLALTETSLAFQSPARITTQVAQAARRRSQNWIALGPQLEPNATPPRVVWTSTPLNPFAPRSLSPSPQRAERLPMKMLGRANEAPPSAENWRNHTTPTLHHQLTRTGGLAPQPANQYLELSDHGIDTVLEITVFTQRLIGRRGIRPHIRAGERLRLEVALFVKLIRTSDGKELYRIYSRYDGCTYRFTRWTANSGGLLKSEMDRAYQELSERIVEKLALPAGSRILASNN